MNALNIAKIKPVFLVAGILLFFSLWLPPTPVIAKQIDAIACKARAYDQGKLWEVRKNGGPKSYIFGTMHSKDPRILQLPGVVMRALNGASVFILETVLTKESIRASEALMRLPSRSSLRQRIGEDRFQKLLPIIAQYNIPAPALDDFKIWAVASLLARPPVRSTSPQEQITMLDRELEKLARNQRKNIFPMETAAEQLGLFDKLSISAQLELLDQAIKDFSGLSQELEEMSRQYLVGKIGWFFCQMQDSIKALSPEMQDFMTNKLIIQRNKNMVTRILPKLETQSSFVAVGALHLPGDQGILSLLKEQGYSLRRRF